MSIRHAVAEVIQVVDGDTLHSHLDIGWGIVLKPRPYGAGTIRIVFPDGKKYDSPEHRSTLGREAKDYALRLTKPGDRLEVVSFGIDDFGRTLGSVLLPNGHDWAELMTEAGYVK